MSRSRTVRPDPLTLHLPSGGADSHAHLDVHPGDDLTVPIGPADVAGVLERAQACGISTIGQVFMGPEAYRTGHAAFGDWPGVFFVLGIHPEDAMTCTGQSLSDMEHMFVRDRRLRAVGEIGLDFYWDDCPRPIQEEALRLQLELGRRLDKPIVIHSRDAAPRTLSILEDEGWAGRPLLWHCFSGVDTIPLLDRILADGWHVSIPGPVTYPGNRLLRDALSNIPLDRLLIETDSPYLAPIPWRGKPNEPAYVVFTAKTVADCLQLPVEEVWQLCGRNTRRFFGLNEESCGSLSAVTDCPDRIA